MITWVILLLVLCLFVYTAYVSHQDRKWHKKLYLNFKKGYITADDVILTHISQINDRIQSISDVNTSVDNDLTNFLKQMHEYSLKNDKTIEALKLRNQELYMHIHEIRKTMIREKTQAAVKEQVKKKVVRKKVKKKTKRKPGRPPKKRGPGRPRKYDLHA